MKRCGTFVPFVLLAAIGVSPAFANGPIAAAPGWTLVDDVPSGCWAERTDDVRVRVLVNKSGHPVLTASRNDWRGDNLVDFDLQIDGGAPVHMHGSGLLSMVLVTPPPAREADLLKASSLTWHLPWGDFTTNVTGIGKAFAAVVECQRNKPQ